MTGAPGGARRVVSLLPAATEMVAALGAEARLVGISHECDYPAWITDRPRVTATPVDSNAGGADIDRSVRELLAQGRPVYTVDGSLLARLAPDLLITQDLCEVCAVTDGSVRSLADTLVPPPRLLPLRARDVDGIFGDLRAVGDALDLADDADELVAGLHSRLDRLRAKRHGSAARVMVLEWLEPPFVAGHWVPELVAAAGGQDVAATPGQHSTERSWDALAALDPEVLLVACCGFDAPRSRDEWHRVAETGTVARRLGRTRWALDGNAYTARPGPRVVDGAERIAAALAGRATEGLIRLD